MIDFSFSEKLVQLKDIIVSSPFFFISLIIGLILLIIMTVGIKKNRRINKIIFMIAWLFVIVFCIVRYFTFFTSILDRLFGRIVEEIYFPSISIYTLMLLFTNFIFGYSLFKKKMDDLIKIVNLALPMELDFLFIMILDIIVKNNIDIYADFEIYTNSKLLVLLEFSMLLFLVWIFIVAVIYLIKKYAVKKVFVNKYKEKDFEVIDMSDNKLSKEEVIDKDNIEEIIDLEDNSVKDNIEIVDL